jgi:hypothetical protein
MIVERIGKATLHHVLPPLAAVARNSCEVKPERALSIFVPMLPAPQKYCS